MKQTVHILMWFACWGSLAATTNAAEGFNVQRREHSLSISWQNRAAAEYVFRDPQTPRSYFTRLHTADGIQVTRNHPPVKGVDATDHDTLHPGLWLAFGDLNGIDYWRNKGRVEHLQFVREPQASDGQLSFSVEEKYVAADGAEVCRGVNTFRFIAGETMQPAVPGTLLLWSTRLQRADGPLVFGPQHEMGLGFRIATPLVVKGGSGSIRGSHGGLNESGNWGLAATWWDYSGNIADRQAGILAVAAPDNTRSVWAHARDYGFLALNPTGPPPGAKDVPSVAFTVPPGESLVLKFGVLLHSSPANDPLNAAQVAKAVVAELQMWKVDATLERENH
jgi:hypothetical protein